MSQFEQKRKPRKLPPPTKKPRVVMEDGWWKNYQCCLAAIQCSTCPGIHREEQKDTK